MINRSRRTPFNLSLLEPSISPWPAVFVWYWNSSMSSSPKLFPAQLPFRRPKQAAQEWAAFQTWLDSVRCTVEDRGWRGAQRKADQKHIPPGRMGMAASAPERNIRGGESVWPSCRLCRGGRRHASVRHRRCVSKSALYAGCFKGSYVAGKPMTADGVAPGWHQTGQAHGNRVTDPQAFRDDCAEVRQFSKRLHRDIFLRFERASDLRNETLRHGRVLDEMVGDPRKSRGGGFASGDNQ